MRKALASLLPLVPNVRPGLSDREYWLGHVAVEQVAFIVLREEWIWLRSSPRIFGSEARGK
jgi:hypothetical protein